MGGLKGGLKGGRGGSEGGEAALAGPPLLRVMYENGHTPQEGGGDFLPLPRP